ncbi:hypothetical protein KJ762_06820 [bacterium]|nr:hypothetical protein [bacterium]MBU1064351.1 hypothetical protein [bacterium]MBU1634206.1 hypothetical protein [bacterium]MBU1873303.1 hypothetical protein [bacterium]
MPKTEKPIEFRLKNIQIAKCSFQKPENAIQEDQELGFSFIFGVQFNEENGEIIIELAANIYLSPEQKIVIGEIKADTHFAINNFSDFVVKKNQFAFPEDFIIMLISISFSTLRGVVIEKSASTLQHQVILPVINVKEIVNKQKVEK